MYHQVYKTMELAGVVQKLLNVQWQSEAGEPIQEKISTREKVEYWITHPDHILDVDEVGNSTCQKDDGNKGGEKYLV